MITKLRSEQSSKTTSTFAGLDGDLDDETGAFTPGRLHTPQEVSKFLLAGKATITVHRTTTGNRFTFKVAKPKQEEGKDWGSLQYFVSVLNGPDNENSYAYIGFLTVNQSGLNYRHGKKAKISIDAPSVKAWRWLYYTIVVRQEPIPKDIEIWHEGRCGRCGRKLTVPSSISSGYGPECIGKLEG